MADLSDRERDLLSRAADNPMDLFQGKSVGWLEDFIRITVGTPARSPYVPGDLKVVIEDLTAQTGVYTVEDDSGQWLYCNGAAASRTTYADLFTKIGTAFGAGDGSTTFNLPDARGRSLFFTGTNAAADLGDNDGVAEASRQAKHAHTNGVTVSAGTLAVASHSHPLSGNVVSAPATISPATGGTTAYNVGGGQISATDSTAPAITGSPSVGGTIGTGTSGDAPAHLFIGSLLVRF